MKRKGDDIEKSLFSDEIVEKTDWTKYYQGKKSWFSSFTQKYTLKKILKAIEEHGAFSNAIGICELGGGNSCFCKQICESISVKEYDIIDSNPLAVKLFEKLDINAQRHESICRNLLFEEEKQDRLSAYDFVYSIGLIEHFRGTDISTMIKRHFEYCKDEGIVLISFPTPTRKYLFTRKCMEMLGVWRFYDEKPIRYEDVSCIFNKYGIVLEHYINRKLPLTQEVVIAKKCATNSDSEYL